MQYLSEGVDPTLRERVGVDGVVSDAPAAAPLVLVLVAAGGLVDWTASRFRG